MVAAATVAADLRVRRRRVADRLRELAQQLLPVGLAVLRHRDPVIDVEHVGHVLDVEQRRRERVVLRLLGVVVRTRDAPGQRLLEDELHRVRIRRGFDFGDFRHLTIRAFRRRRSVRASDRLRASVDVLAIELNAACSVCHGRIAHFTRVGRSRTPANTVSRPRWCGSSPDRACRSPCREIPGSASPRPPRVLPLTSTVIIDADALQIAHDSPSNAMPSMRSPSSFERDADVIAAQRIQPFRMVARVCERAPVARLAVVVEDDFLIQLLWGRPLREHLLHAADAGDQRIDLGHACCRTRTRRAHVAGTPKRCITGCAQWCPVRTATPSSLSSVPTSCGCTPSTANDSTAAFFSAVPMMRTPGMRFTCSVA